MRLDRNMKRDSGSKMHQSSTSGSSSSETRPGKCKNTRSPLQKKLVKKIHRTHKTKVSLSLSHLKEKRQGGGGGLSHLLHYFWTANILKVIHCAIHWVIHFYHIRGLTLDWDGANLMLSSVFFFSFNISTVCTAHQVEKTHWTHWCSYHAGGMNTV